MNWNPNLIFYACIAKGITILAEFNSKDADLGALAAKCLEKTPPYHSTFSHTVRSRTYMFLILDPFVYFGIFDDSLDKSDCLSFLTSVKDSFLSILQVNNNPAVNGNDTTLTSHCFQGEFNPVFHQLLAPNSEFDMRSPSPDLKHDSGESLDSLRGKKVGSMPLLADAGKRVKKKKKRFFGGGGGGGGEKKTNDGAGMQENKVDVILSDDDVSSTSREFSVVMHHSRNGLFGSDLGGGHQRAKRLWKKQLLVVLSLDLIICIVLFAIWLWVCQGFKCLAA